MRVVATREGYCGKIRKVGEVFALPEGVALSSKWMLDVNTPEGQAFVAGTSGGGRKMERDKLTGERLAAGGIAEQLAVALEDGRRLRERVAELEAEITVLQARQAPAPAVEPTHPADESVGEAAKQVEVSQRVRRRVPRDE